eukprot:TRINITY_DN4933_c0_g1_i1.p1 TRINITY_DN4933_c0_g1~~TRINITY_DN4933_c0_g1_i1.p1  ORF type:complete len:119 (-),score=29.06 TRINITY_DN4933_c0_g1_i1:75-431(-)
MMEQLLAARPRLEPIVFGEETENLKRTQATASTEVNWKSVADTKRRVKRPGQRPATTTVRPGKDETESSGAKARMVQHADMTHSENEDKESHKEQTNKIANPGMSGLLEEIRRRKEKK